MKRAILAAPFLSLLALVAATAADRPNIVFIFTDDHCEQALSAYDPARITTPNMDRIAKEGMRFQSLLRHQFDLRAQSGGDPNGQVQSP